MKTGKVLFGILAGVAIGATLGLLFAPDKGTSTRKKISKKSDDYAQALEEKFNQFIDSFTDKYEAAKDEVNRMADNGKHKVEETVAGVADAIRKH